MSATKDFILSLDSNHRNHLRIILLTQSGLADLKEALGIQRVRVISHADHATGRALCGNTVELFPEHMRRSAPGNLRSDHER